MNVHVVHRLSGVCVAAAALAASANASADYYGVLLNVNINNGDADQGDAVWLYTSVLDVTSCSDFVNHEMWYGVNGSSSPQYWVEVGLKMGWKWPNGGCVLDVGFWAENKSQTGYYEYYPATGGYSANTWYQAVIQQGNPNQPCNWDVWFGGVYYGTSYTNCPGISRKVAGGIETTTQGSTTYGPFAKGYLFGWEELDRSRQWLSGWDNPAFQQFFPPTIQWQNSSDDETEEVLNESP